MRAKATFPKWAPAGLVEHARKLRPKAEEEKRRARAGEVRALDKRADAEKRQLYVGMYFVSDGTQYEYLRALLTAPQMETVWKNLQRRAGSFKPKRSLFGGGGLTQEGNLLGACVDAELKWINLPKRTRIQSRKVHKDIAATALQLAELLLQVESKDLLLIREFVDDEHEKDGRVRFSVF